MAPLPRLRPSLALGLVAVVLAGCGQDDSSRSPFAPEPKDDRSATATDLGFPVVATRNTTRTATDDGPAAAAAVARAVYSGGAAETQARAIALVNQRDWRVALAASALNADPVGAPTLFSDGDDLPDATRDALRQLRPAGSPGIDNAQVIRVGGAPRPEGLRATAIEGSDPAGVALGIDRFLAAAKRRASDAVLVVSSEQPAFALPAAAYAAKSGTPIAFVGRDAVPADTVRQLRDHQDPTIYVLGPSKVISPAVTKQLRRYGTVRRVGGQDPVSNAIAFARYDDNGFGWNIVNAGHGFLVARSDATLPALSLAPLAGTGLHGPLLLLDRADRLAEPVRSYLLDVQPGIAGDPVNSYYNRAWLSGSTDAISPAVQSQIDALMEVTSVDVDGARLRREAPAGTATTGTTATPTPPPSKEDER